VGGEVITSEKANFKVELLTDQLENPWGMVQLPDGSFLVTERPGRLRVIRDGELVAEPITGIPNVFAAGQGGLLDIQLHPGFKGNGWIYLAFSDPRGKGTMTKIVRGRVKAGAWVDEETIFEAAADQYTAAAHHFGCRMQFDENGYLFFAIGDRGDVTTPENNAQKLTNAKGKIHRLHDDGRIPKDNPFVGEPGAEKSIWTYGNRNPQGLRFDRDGTLWAVEHGPRGGDELNVLRKGENYGWPVVTFGINYNGKPISDLTEALGMVSPVIHWTPSIAVGGIDFYHGDQFPAWDGNLFATALAHQKLVRLEIDAANEVTHQEILLEKSGRIRDVRVFQDGSLYVIYDDPGKIVRLVPTGS
jgi:glucose/arabinose dehydrogenase